MARTATLPVLNGESGLSRYLSEIRKFPMLEPEEEFMLAKRWHEHDDPRRRAQTGHQPSAPRGEDRHGLSRLRPADRRSDLRRQCRPDAGGEAVRARDAASGSRPTPCGGSGPRSRNTSCARGPS